MTKWAIGLVQQSCGADIGANIQKSVDGIREAAKRGAGIVALQELHRSLYFCQSEDAVNFDLAESIPGPSTDLFSKLAKELGIVLVVSLFEKRAPGVYHNTAVVLDSDGSVAGKYRKMHIPDDPNFYEKYYFTPGDTGFVPVKTSAGKIGVLVCWDQWYPEAARIMALQGAELLIYPTAIGWDPADTDGEKARQRDSWITVQRSHAIANGIPVASVNRVGFEKAISGSGGIDFWGSSFVAGCQGEFVTSASTDREEVIIAEMEKNRSEKVRRTWPFFRDRRIDAYGDILKRFGN
jgi:N-carbamoylputrescine amidase